MKKRICVALLCGAICLSLGACTKDELSPTPSAPSSAAVTAAPTQAPTPKPTATPAPTSSPTAVPIATPTPAGTFDEAFEIENPIKGQLQDDLDMASSVAAIVRAYTDAAHHWQSLIGIAYYDALAVLSEEEAAFLETKQAQWESEIQGKIDAINAQAAEDYPDGEGSVSGEGQIWAASEICALYEERARTLCWAKFSADGVMPDFSEAMPNTEAMG